MTPTTTLLLRELHAIASLRAGGLDASLNVRRAQALSLLLVAEAIVWTAEGQAEAGRAIAKAAEAAARWLRGR